MPSTTTREATTLTVDQMELSRFNCRLNREDREAVDAIALSLPERGLIHALQVHPLAGSKKFGVYAGARRLRAHAKAIKDGTLPPDHPIRVEILRGASDAELLELSMLENLPRRDLRDYEQYLGAKRAVALGHTPEQVAAALGQDMLWMRKALRMAELAQPVFDALVDGRITNDQAIAFAATEDQECQLVAWRDLAGTGGRLPTTVDQATIRRALRIGDAELDKLLRYVGEEAYRAAGGSWELDLFAGNAGARGRLTAEGALRALAAGKLDAFKADLRRRAGREVRFVAEPPAHPEWKTADQRLRLHQPSDGTTIDLPEGNVVGHAYVTPRGEAEVAWYWASLRAQAEAQPVRRKAKAETKPARKSSAALAEPGGATARAADAQARQDFGGTRDVTGIFRSLRRWILRGALVHDARNSGTIGLELLVWSQARWMLVPETDLAGRIGVAELRSREEDPVEAGRHLQDAPATREIDAAVKELRARPWAREEDLARSFELFLDEDDDNLCLAAALVAGRALDRSANLQHYDSAVHHAIAAATGIAEPGALRHLWRPTGDLLGLIQRDHRLEIAAPFVEPATLKGWSKLDDHALTAMVVRTVGGDGASIRKGQESAAAEWVHPLLAFDPPPENQVLGENDAAELEHAEAAE